MTPEDQARYIALGIETETKRQAIVVHKMMTDLLPELAAKTLTPISFHDKLTALIGALSDLDAKIQFMWNYRSSENGVLESHHDIPDGAEAPRARTAGGD